MKKGWLFKCFEIMHGLKNWKVKLGLKCWGKSGIQMLERAGLKMLQNKAGFKMLEHKAGFKMLGEKLGLKCWKRMGLKCWNIKLGLKC